MLRANFCRYQSDDVSNFCIDCHMSSEFLIFPLCTQPLVHWSVMHMSTKAQILDIIAQGKSRI